MPVTVPTSTAAVAAIGVIAAMSLAGCAGMSDPTGLFGKSNAASQPASTEAPAAAAGALPELTNAAGPSAPTAVVEESFTLDGAILPVARGQSRVVTRADRRRSDGTINFDNWLMRRLAPDGHTANIVRVDRGLVWNMVPAKHQYTECPLTGCPRSAKRDNEPSKPEPGEQPHRSTEPSCPVSLKATDLKVDATGERRTVNGFATERYLVDWMVQMADRNGGTNTNQVRLELWTTPEAGAIREVQSIQEAFQHRYASAVAHSDSPVARYLPPNVASAMTSLMRGIDGGDQRTRSRWATEMRKVRGYPIATNMSWTSSGTICGGEGGSTGDSPQASAASIGSMLGGMLGARKTETGAAAPLISFSQEVRTIAVKPVGDALFSPPADYQRSN